MLTHWNRLTASPRAAAGRLCNTILTSSQADYNFSQLTDIGADCSGIIATGADASSRIAVGYPAGLALGLNQGHLSDDYNLVRFDDVLRIMSRHFPPGIVVSDSNPGLASSRVARALASRTGALYISVDHAHAHLAAVMAEHHIHGRVTGILLDSTRVSDPTDNCRFNGSGVYICSRRECRQVTGDVYFRVRKNALPWELAAGLLMAVYDDCDAVARLLSDRVSEGNVRHACFASDDTGKSVVTSGGSSLWNAVAALIGMATDAVDGPFWQCDRLERLAEGMTAAPYHFDTSRPSDILPVIDELVHDLSSHTDPRVIAARFHATEARRWSLMAQRAAASVHSDRVVADGSLLGNRLLRNLLQTHMSRLGLQVIMPERLSAGDDALAIGQATVAAALRA